jgi:hypothetical protein
MNIKEYIDSGKDATKLGKPELFFMEVGPSSSPFIPSFPYIISHFPLPSFLLFIF